MRDRFGELIKRIEKKRPPIAFVLEAVDGGKFEGNRLILYVASAFDRAILSEPEVVQFLSAELSKFINYPGEVLVKTSYLDDE